ncbi:uncharacterized protein LOC135393016 [Ornithodoros turicata]|uniref:uncharacterized protein LOC135393016 n=1 Tax=Ornithodoros turicata TaxID=34597 RepID=UPI003138B461
MFAHEDRDHWVSHLPLVLLGIRAALKSDLGCSCADLVYGCSLRLPAEFFSPSKPDISPSALLQRLHRSFSIVRATPSRAASHHSPNIPQDLPTATHVFLRTDSVRKSLSPPYSGPHPVLARNDKTYRILVNGNEDTVSVDRLKPAYLENPGIVASFAPGPSSSVAPNSRSSAPGRSKHVSWSDSQGCLQREGPVADDTDGVRRAQAHRVLHAPRVTRQPLTILLGHPDRVQLAPSRQ